MCVIAVFNIVTHDVVILLEQPRPACRHDVSPVVCVLSPIVTHDVVILLRRATANHYLRGGPAVVERERQTG